MSLLRNARTAALIASVAAGLALAAPVALAQGRGLRIGDIAPTALVETLDGERADLAQFVGRKPVLIEFWATWCPLCRELEPTMKALNAKYSDRMAFVHIVVPQNQTPQRAKEYIARRELPGQFFFDRDGSAYKAFAAYHTSYIVVLDKAGRVVHSEDGAKQDLEAAIRKALE